MNNRILFLTLKTFSLTGGIEKVCKIFAKVLCDLYPNEEKQSEIWSMYDQSKDLDERYCSPPNFYGFAGQRIFFVFMAVFQSKKFGTIILSHIHLLFVAKLIRLFSAKKKIILLAHGIEIWRNLPNWKKRVLREDQIEIWAVSRYTADVIAEKHQIPKENITVVNNCLDPFLNLPKTFEKPIHLIQKYYIRPEQPVLFTLTRLASSEQYKGYDLVIEALPELLKIYPDLIYLIGGKADAAEQGRLNGLLREKNLDNHVKLVGYIPDGELSDYFCLADLYVMPSRKEGFGLVFIEAAACGCKVIGGNEDGTVDALLRGELGMLVNPQDKKAIHDTIIKALKTERSEEEAQAIQQKCLMHFNYPQYVKQVKQLLQSA